ncbi:hypothetical protein BX283_6785 [Streptomyces sp. TLI_146]|nr:hypothetical protein BX283_6785 [Streptomyces sp. TLI_146]
MDGAGAPPTYTQADFGLLRQHALDVRHLTMQAVRREHARIRSENGTLRYGQPTIWAVSGPTHG